MTQSLAERLEEQLLRAGVASGVRLIVGFSGGRDSVVLVELLKVSGWNDLVLCHLDHGFRMESASDAEWARDYAIQKECEFRGDRVDVAALAAERGLGFEEVARKERYGFFERVAREVGCSRVVLAHHADDQVETFLFRLLRGSGSQGLGGMAPASEHCDGKMSVLRPMLGIWRSEINECVQERALVFREDLSNADLRWTRNRIRHELLPEMERVMQRPVGEAIWRAAELMRAEAELLDQLELADGGVRTGDLSVAELNGVPLALRRRRVLSWLRSQSVHDVSFDVVESILGLLIRVRPARVNLPRGLFVRRRAGRIFLERPHG